MKSGKVLVVDDEPAEREGLARMVGQWGYEVETASSAEEALSLVESQHPAVVVTDLVLPEMDGLTLLQKLRETGRPPVVLLVTGHATVETAVEAMRHGAFDYLTKPVDATRLQVLLEKSIEQESLSREVNFLRHQLRQKGTFGQLVGQSKGMQEVYRWIELAATSMAPVLVFGESGTGKELVARTIHELSNRRNKPFVAINCAAIPETLIESELFGHEPARSPAPPSAASDASSWPTRGRCSSTRSRRWTRTRRPSCSACSRRATSGASAARPRSRWTCASSRRRTACRARRSPRGSSARTCSTA
jgi:DNA-binding NtrC family response regulator